MIRTEYLLTVGGRPFKLEASLQTKTVLYLAIAATSVVEGFLFLGTSAGRGPHLLAFVPSVVAWILIYAWFNADVVQRCVRTSTTFNGLIIGFSFLALPIYFFRSRGVLCGLASSVLFYVGIAGWSVGAALLAGLRPALHIG